jgi:hypothetical protein
MGLLATNGANVNGIWATGTGDSGYGEAALSTVAAAATITATQWATLNSKITSMASHQGTTITSRANPTTGDTIAILADLATDITNLHYQPRQCCCQWCRNCCIQWHNKQNNRHWVC